MLPSLYAASFVCSLFGILNTSFAQDVTLIPFGSTWKYRDNGSNQGTAWRASSFNDGTWASGPAELGYGDGDEATVVSYGASFSNKYVTTYFRRTFSLPDVSVYKGFALRIKRDDGFVLYINGTEAMRENFDQSAVSSTSLAAIPIADAEEGAYLSEILVPGQFQNGDNTIAVEIHQSAVNSSDISFDLELKGLDAEPSLFRGPYLQAASSNSIVVKWKTDAPSASRVRYGSAPGALDLSATDALLTLDHEVRLTALAANTTYYYAIGTMLADLAGDEASFHFRTRPPIGSPSPVRIWAFGDAGTGDAHQRAVRDAYTSYSASGPPTDVWLLLGDNAYEHGRESEYQLGMFQNMYEAILRNTPLMPSPGNHEYYSGANGNANTGPYYALFSPPKLGECGGLPSNTEAYYSYDIGNVHFISLDSYGVSLAANGAMATWLVNDVTQAQADQRWIIAYWHHPPYSKGSHNSDNATDSGGLMRDMRQNILPILESHGVDLVLCGHSHTYERSFLINGHYGVSSTFNTATMRLDGTAGRADEAGPYLKPGSTLANMGTVYMVCGVAGQRETGGALNHPAMFMSTDARYGSLVVDVVGNTLSARFLSDQGQIIDHFDIRRSFGPVRVAVKALLEGPYRADSLLMNDNLRSAGLLPIVQPFTGVFTHVGSSATGSISPTVLTVTGANAIVDWVFVELRDAFDPKRIVAAKAALIQRDGDVVDVDGLSPVAFQVPAGNYHLALRHRNHLGVMTAAPQPLNAGPAAIDLTSSAFATYGTDARKDIGGRLVLWGGNVVRDGALLYTGSGNDRDPILQRIGGTDVNTVVNGYQPDDVNLDGTIRYTGSGNDRDPILVNIGGVNPNAIRVEQLP